MSLASLCNHTATLQRPTASADAYGGESNSFSALLSDFACTVQPASGRLIEQFARLSMQISHTLYTPTDITSARAGDRVVFNSENYIVVWKEDQAGRASVYAIHLLKKD